MVAQAQVWGDIQVMYDYGHNFGTLTTEVGHNHKSGNGYKIDGGCVTFYQKDGEGKTTRTTLEVDFVCNKGSERVYIQSAYSLPDEEKQKQEQRSLTLTDDSFTKIIITTDDIPTHLMPTGITMMNVFDYLLN